MPRKANYPEWVMKHLKKGTYINKVGDKYYLYAAHSERVKGTDKVRRVSDGYLGRITEKDGLIPPKDKLAGIEFKIMDFGFVYAVTELTKDIFKGTEISYKKDSAMIYSCAVMTYISNSFSQALFQSSYLSVIFPDEVIPEKLTSQQKSGLERTCRMITDRMDSIFGKETDSVKILLETVHIVSASGKLYMGTVSENVKELAGKYNIDWSDKKWQR